MKIVNSRIMILIMVLMLSLSLIISGCTGVQAKEPEADLNKYQGKIIFMHVGSPLILAGEEISFLDKEDFDVAATVYKQRALIPLRAVAEYLGGNVSYDAANREAAVSYKDCEYVFPIGKAEVLVKQSRKTNKIVMDTKAQLIDNRTMVPVRILAEDLFSKFVDYNDDVIMISDEPLSISKEKGLLAAVKAKIGYATKAKSEEQLIGLMKNKEVVHYGEFRSGVDTATSEAVMDAGMNEAQDLSKSKSDAGAESFGAYEDSASEGYSKTNIQVEGIDEADIVKTDGKYLYYAGNNAVRIIRAEGSKLTEVSNIKLPNEKYVQEIYLDRDRLILLGNREEIVEGTYQNTDRGGDEPSMDIMMDSRMIYPGSYKSFSYIDIYDVSNPAKPSLLKGHEMEGYYQTSRKSGDNVYLITGTGWHGGIVRPLMKDSVDGDKHRLMDLSDIMVMPQPIQPGYIILSAIDIADNSRTEVEAITAFGSTVYMNETALYLASDNFNEMTNVTKFCIDGMNIGYAGTGKVEGNVLNQFSMDEYEGNLRIVTTQWNEGNNLFVLNDSLNVIGSVTGLAKGETIYSARFIGDKGYVVTFRTIDPLFVFDLSDPTEPKVTGELKIPGFSNYLHPVGEDLILGIGMETRESDRIAFAVEHLYLTRPTLQYCAFL
jgi:inhibitor of cysteine peptidase